MSASRPQPIPAQFTIRELAQSYRSGELQPKAVVESALEMAKDHTEDNFFIHLDETIIDRAPRFDDPTRNARPPLAGIPFVVKDNIHVAGMPCTAGTPGLRAHVPDTHNPVVENLLGAGALMLGKTNLHELAFGITSVNGWSGAVANPVSPGYIAGGSSGGSAAAVSAGIVGFALGTDTGGSMRIPAALCGICGYRPSRGRYSSKGVAPISNSRDTVGVMARRLEDIRYIDNLLVPGQPDPILPAKMRLGVVRDYFDIDPSIQASVDKAMSKLAVHCELVEDPIDAWLSDAQACSFPIALFEVMRDLPAYLQEYGIEKSIEQLAREIVSPDVHGLFAHLLADGAIPEEVYLEAMKTREGMIEKFHRAFRAHRLDALVLPTTPLPACKIEEDLSQVRFQGRMVDTFSTYIRNCDPASIAGATAVTIPITPNAEGLSVGLELNGLPGHDQKLLALAQRLRSIGL